MYKSIQQILMSVMECTTAQSTVTVLTLLEAFGAPVMMDIWMRDGITCVLVNL